MKFSLNQNSCRSLTLFEFIKFAKRFDGIELDFEKIKKSISEGNSFKNIFELLETYNLKIKSIFALEDFSLSLDHVYKTKTLLQLREMMEYSYKLESNLIIVYPSIIEASNNSIEISKHRIINRTMKKLEELGNIAFKEDINLGFEFLSNSSISTLTDALEVMKHFEYTENVGLVIDTFHLIKSHSDIHQLKAKKQPIFLIQLSDLKYESEEQLKTLQESDRVFPGYGNLNLREFLDFMEKLSHDNTYSIELFEDTCKTNLYEKLIKLINY